MIRLISTIIASFIIASVLNIYPLGFSWAKYRPMFLMVALFFWVIHQPRYVGLFCAFFVGLSADLLLDYHFGFQAFAAVFTTLFLQIVTSFSKNIQPSATLILMAIAIVIFGVLMAFFEFLVHGYVAHTANAIYATLLALLLLWWPLDKINQKIGKEFFL